MLQQELDKHPDNWFNSSTFEQFYENENLRKRQGQYHHPRLQ